MLDKVYKEMKTKLTWDHEVKGLYLKFGVRTNTFGFQFRNKSGVERRITIGHYPTLSWDMARIVARQYALEVAMGKDPWAEVKKLKGNKTIGELFEIVLKEHWSKPRYIESNYNREVRQNFKRNIEPYFGSKKVAEIRGMEIKAWHKKFEEKPIAGNRSLSVLSTLFDFAIDKEWLPLGSNPCQIVKPFTERKRTRYASIEELKTISAILKRDSAKYPREVLFIYLLMFSGARPRAIERAEWNMLNYFFHEGKTFAKLTFSGKTTKTTGEDEVVILPPQVCELLKKIPNKHGSITGIKMPSVYWNQIRKEANCEDLWARDWRRFLASIGVSSGVPLRVVGQLLNHQSNSTTERYALAIDTKKIEAAGLIGDKIEELTTQVDTSHREA